MGRGGDAERGNATETATAGHRQQAHRPNRPTPQATRRKPKRPTNQRTKNNPNGHTATTRNGGKQQRRAPMGEAQAPRGHGKPPTRTNRRRETTRTHEPRQQPRGTGHEPKSTEQPRNKDTKNKSTPRAAQHRKKPPQPPKKPPQPQKRTPQKRKKTTQGDPPDTATEGRANTPSLLKSETATTENHREDENRHSGGRWYAARWAGRFVEVLQGKSEPTFRRESALVAWLTEDALSMGTC